MSEKQYSYLPNSYTIKFFKLSNEEKQHSFQPLLIINNLKNKKSKNSNSKKQKTIENNSKNKSKANENEIFDKKNYLIIEKRKKAINAYLNNKKNENSKLNKGKRELSVKYLNNLKDNHSSSTISKKFPDNRKRIYHSFQASKLKKKSNIISKIKKDESNKNKKLNHCSTHNQFNIQINEEKKEEKEKDKEEKEEKKKEEKKEDEKKEEEKKEETKNNIIVIDNKSNDKSNILMPEKNNGIIKNSVILKSNSENKIIVDKDKCKTSDKKKKKKNKSFIKDISMKDNCFNNENNNKDNKAKNVNNIKVFKASLININKNNYKNSNTNSNKIIGQDNNNSHIKTINEDKNKENSEVKIFKPNMNIFKGTKFVFLNKGLMFPIEQSNSYNEIKINNQCNNNINNININNNKNYIFENININYDNKDNKQYNSEVVIENKNENKDEKEYENENYYNEQNNNIVSNNRPLNIQDINKNGINSEMSQFTFKKEEKLKETNNNDNNTIQCSSLITEKRRNELKKFINFSNKFTH